MGQRQSGLGRGLGALIPQKAPGSMPGPVVSDVSDVRVPAPSSEATDFRLPPTVSVMEIPVGLVDPNPHQPRTHFDHTQLEDLINSIREHGVLQPIVVTKKDDGRYELIAGERRLRASKIADRATVPAIVRTASEQQKLELALIENIQRQELNPLEEAGSYVRLQTEFNLTQDDVAKRVGKSRSQVANTIRLLQLPQEAKDALASGRISQSNARTLLAVPNESERMSLFHQMLEGDFTVRESESRIPHPRRARGSFVDPNMMDIEKRLRAALGTRVLVKRDPRGEGEVRITFLNDEDLQTIVKKVAGE